jgi:hypothetical protein
VFTLTVYSDLRHNVVATFQTLAHSFGVLRENQFSVPHQLGTTPAISAETVTRAVAMKCGKEYRKFR